MGYWLLSSADGLKKVKTINPQNGSKMGGFMCFVVSRWPNLIPYESDPNLTVLFHIQSLMNDNPQYIEYSDIYISMYVSDVDGFYGLIMVNPNILHSHNPRKKTRNQGFQARYLLY
jgi:hypothetical protein